MPLAGDDQITAVLKDRSQKKRTELVRKLKEIFRRFESQPLDRIVQLINPIIRGWVNYFAVGFSSECFGFVKDWVEKKVRRHLCKARGPSGLRLEDVE